MSRLEDFLTLPNVSEMVYDVNAGERLGTLKIKPMSVQQYKSYQDRCKGKINKSGMDFDSNKFYLLIVANQVIEPNMNDANFLSSCGYPTATDFINAKFLAGELTEIASQIVSLSGFDLDVNSEIETAKN